MRIKKKLNFCPKHNSNMTSVEWLTYKDVQSNYEDANSDEELIDLCFFWYELSQSFISGHEIYYNSFLALFSEITNLSYESKLNFLC